MDLEKICKKKKKNSRIGCSNAHNMTSIYLESSSSNRGEMIEVKVRYGYKPFTISPQLLKLSLEEFGQSPIK